MKLLHGEPHPDRVVIAYPRLNGRHGVEKKPGTITQATSVGVLPFIGFCGEELGEYIAGASLDFHRVEAGFLCPYRAVGKLVNNSFYLRNGELPRHIAAKRGNGGGRHCLATGELRAG